MNSYVFDDHPEEKCGVVAAYSSRGDVMPAIFLGMMTLQHRGQEGFGAYTFDGTTFHKKKGLGLINGPDEFEGLGGKLGIGHLRYTTAGESPIDMSKHQSIEDFVQPVEDNSVKFGVRLGFNGNIINYDSLKKGFRESGMYLPSHTDAEVILKTLTTELMKTRDVEISVRKTMNALDGSYSVTAITGENELIAFRDPQGFRPLCYGENDELKMVASESVALDVNGIRNHIDVEPGELLIVGPGKTQIRKRITTASRRAHCMFEYVYFARPDSTMNGIDVYTARMRLGQMLAKTYKTKADVIVPVPDTARPAAEGISRETKIPVLEGLIKNRYVGRTFIMPHQEGRDAAVRLKLNTVRAVLHEKNVLLVDDSIVRGTTMRKIVGLIREGGAKRVDVWITCPPITSPCYYGIDMKTREELTAAVNSEEQIRKIIQADELHYQTLGGLIEALGLPEQNWCLGCLTGKYVTSTAQKLADDERRR